MYTLQWCRFSCERKCKILINIEEQKMDKDRSEGKGKKVTGSIKKGVGKVTGNRRLEDEGRAEKTGGKVQNKVGEVKDKARDKLK